MKLPYTLMHAQADSACVSGKRSYSCGMRVGSGVEQVALRICGLLQVAVGLPNIQ